MVGRKVCGAGQPHIVYPSEFLSLVPIITYMCPFSLAINLMKRLQFLPKDELLKSHFASMYVILDRKYDSPLSP